MSWDPDCASFATYLAASAATLRELCAEGNLDVEHLPAVVGRPKSSPPKLIDEYNWIVYTLKLPPPSAEDERVWRARIAQRLSDLR